MDKYAGYPGDVAAPLDLEIAEDVIGQLGWEYGDIVQIPEKDGKAQRDIRGFTIHPDQQFRLVRPK